MLIDSLYGWCSYAIVIVMWGWRRKLSVPTQISGYMNPLGGFRKQSKLAPFDSVQAHISQSIAKLETFRTTHWHLALRHVVISLFFWTVLFGLIGAFIFVTLGFLGALSITSIFVAVCALISPRWLSNAWCSVIVLAGVLLYASTMGLLSFELYALGYSPLYFCLPLIAITLFECYRRRWSRASWACCVLTGCVLILISMQPDHWSQKFPAFINTWDLIIDPWLWCYAVIRVLQSLRSHLNSI